MQSVSEGDAIGAIEAWPCVQVVLPICGRLLNQGER